MENYPVLRLIKRHGRLGALVVALAVACLIAGLTWVSIGPLALLAALVGGGIVFVGILSYVELVTLTLEMLLPQ